MDFAIPRETRRTERRVALVPHDLPPLIEAGHRVYLEPGAGEPSGFGDGAYVAAGATLAESPETLYRAAQVIVRVAPPSRDEAVLIGPDHLLLAFMRLAGDLTRTEILRDTGAVCLALEAIRTPEGARPIADPQGALLGARLVEIAGSLLADRPGRSLGGARVVVLAEGPAGAAAANAALSSGAEVTVLGAGHGLAGLSRGPISAPALDDALPTADVVICALVEGPGRAPIVVSRDQVSGMQPGALIVDGAIDRGGCVATSRPTTPDAQTHETSGVTHFCVRELAGAMGREASVALSSAVLPFLRQIANRGYRSAAADDPTLAAGLVLARRQIVDRDVAAAFGMDHVEVASVLQ